MKSCMSCNAEISDAAVYCTKCGAQQPKRNGVNFCSNCGIKLNKDAKYCSECGRATSLADIKTSQYTNNSEISDIEGLVNTLAEKERVSGVFWLVIAMFQVFLLIYMWSIRELYTVYETWNRSSLSTEFIINMCFLTIVCVLNIFGGATSLRISQIAKSSPNWFNKRYMKSSRYVWAIIYNGLIAFDGLYSDVIYLMVVGAFAFGISLYDLANVRTFAISHMKYFQQMEASIGDRNG